MAQVKDVFASTDVSSEKDFRPVQMEVREACSDRGRIPARVCLLDEDLETYRVYAIPDSFLAKAQSNEPGTTTV
jgi:anaphase-promoting complex subunit 4